MGRGVMRNQGDEIAERDKEEWHEERGIDRDRHRTSLYE